MLLGEGPSSGGAEELEGVEVDGYDTSYYDSTDNEDSFDEEDDGCEIVRKHSVHHRFDSSAAVPTFCVGMRFGNKFEFKQAVKDYGIQERKCIKFVKDEGYRVRAKCTWPNCPWVIILSTNSRHESWQVASFNSEHKCPPRRDNRLVTANRIANRFEKIIKANPTWNMAMMKETVLEEMLVDVSISKCKRAKRIVLDRTMDATKGEYSKVFEYQAELLRSNPGSTVVVKLDPDAEKPTFLRFYMCFAAIKRGFMAGCRKVIGLDGCFFKGATNGELLCALGRDANNQMYLIAWAVVEKENIDSWRWFCELLFRDIDVGDGEDWVFISDQQKGILNAVEYWAPRAEHRNCARHIYANWKKTFRDKDR
ncbi:uncharacterized protein LOC100846822 [Brachypodium distachyon]|uniref:uncharacterized protein LOC100846822 n=1 Tax=Brachypodium distachyon TaxID=15368 RepID=UPI00052FE088|nr:uncharacterized protein LOC100846822 [Brachypodium distachyon]|eukprot:XP_024317517.1 uncharacterized protein LOC100846822 [Brachypodium distachyon]